MRETGRMEWENGGIRAVYGQPRGAVVHASAPTEREAMR